MKAQILGVPGINVRLVVVQPVQLHAVVEIPFFHFVPNVTAPLGIGGVIIGKISRPVDVVVNEDVLGVHPALVVDQQAALLHFSIVFTERADRRPDGNHQPDSQLFQFLRHGRRVGPALRVEAPVAHVRPVEEVADDHRQRQPAPFVFTRHIEQLCLGFIAQLALPETGRPGRHGRGMPGHVGVTLQDFGVIVPAYHVIIQLLRAVGHPARGVHAQLDAPQAGVVPQETVTLVRNHEGNRNFGVALLKLDHRTFIIQAAVLVLSKSEDFFTIPGFEPGFDLVKPPIPVLEMAVGRGKILDRRLFEQRFTGNGVQELHVTGAADLRAQFAVADRGSLPAHLHFRF